MRSNGLLMNIEGEAEVEITSYYAKNLINKETSGSIFYITDNVKLSIRNVYIKM